MPQSDFPVGVYEIEMTAKFRRDLKRARKQGRDIEKLKKIVALLASGRMLPDANRDHQLSGQFGHARECHIEPDWLLIYQINNGKLLLTLTRTGTHAELGLA